MIRVKDIDKGWKALMASVTKSTGTHTLRVGVFADQPRTEGQLTNPEIATVHEYGSPAANIPERSFIRSTVDKNREAYNATVRKIAGLILDGKDTEPALNLFGMRVANDIKRTIQQGIPPPLQPETVARKGSTKPLVDTGQLLSSITWKVEGVK